MDNLKRTLESNSNYIVKRKKLKHASIDLIRSLINSPKGEAIQALYMVFENDTFSFETQFLYDAPCKFVSYLNLEGYSFIGYGNTKTCSRSSACRAALMYLIDDLKSNSTETRDDLPVNLAFFIENKPEDDLPDIIASLILKKYELLKNEFKQHLPWYKVIAGIVMIPGNDHSSGKVLVLSTGTKCTEPKNILTNGTVVVDSHAEILSRRAFQYFLYSQIRRYENRSDSILTKSDGKYELKKDILLYLFVSSAPCGDCRIFAVSRKDNAADKHPNRISRGVLRIKLDGSNCTVPINNVLKYETHDRLMIMSCSDKLLKMNVLGMQGSLLSNFVKPIYMAGIIIGDLYHKSHVTRALYGRIEGTVFNPPFRLNSISICGVRKEPPAVTKCPKINMNWICGESIEIMNSITGKTAKNEMSRLCKYRLFEIFLQLWKTDSSASEIQQTYEYFKKRAADYQNVKKVFHDVLDNKYLGKWIRRKTSFDKFSLMPG